MPSLSVVVIGLNEGERLERCLASVRSMMAPEGGMELIYVDSGSTDGSLQAAQDAGARIIILESERPTAGAARNAGWRVARAPFVFFVDGDCIVEENFAVEVLPEFDTPRVAVVFGRLRERRKEDRFFSRMMEFDRFNPQPGPVPHCAGIALVRRSALELTNGFDPGLIACEEPDLCVRLRERDLVILRVDNPMAEHDLGMRRLSQYLRRSFRMGYGVTQVSTRYPTTQVFDSHQAGVNRAWGALFLFLLTLSIGGVAWWYSWGPLLATGLSLVAVTLAMAGKARRKNGSEWRTCLTYGLLWSLKQIPAQLGSLTFRCDQLLGRKRAWIHCK